MKKLKDILINPDMQEWEINENIRKEMTEMGYDLRNYGMWGEGEVHRENMRGKKFRIWRDGKVITCYTDIVAVKGNIMYVIEIKKESGKRMRDVTYIMQGVGQLLRYYYEIEEQVSSMQIEGVLIYCGFLNKEKRDAVKATIKRFNLPIKLVVLKRRE